MKDFDCHRPNGKISCKKDEHFNVLLFHISWMKKATFVYVRPKFENSEKWGTFRASFPLPLPVRFSISSDSEIEEN